MPLSRLSFGTRRLFESGGRATANVSPNAHADSLLRAALELGITAIDTSPTHPGAEQRVGSFLGAHDLHEEVALTTKLPSLATATTSHVEKLVEESLIGSLRRLRAEVVDAYLLEDARDIERHGQALLDALAQQIVRGRVLSVGFAACGPSELAFAGDYPELAVVQHPFNLLDRRLLESGWPSRLVSTGTRLQIANAYFEELATEPRTAAPAPRRMPPADVVELEHILAEFGLNPTTAALPFVLSIDPDTVVVNVDRREELEALVASLDCELPAEFYSALRNRLGDLPAVDGDP